MGLALISNSKLWGKSTPGDLARPLRMWDDAFNHIHGQTGSGIAALISLTLLFVKKIFFFLLGCIRSQLGHVGSYCSAGSLVVMHRLSCPLACGILAPMEHWRSPPLILLKTVIFFKNWKAWDLWNSKWFAGSHAFRSISQTLGNQIAAKALKDFGPSVSQYNTSDTELLCAPWDMRHLLWKSSQGDHPSSVPSTVHPWKPAHDPGLLGESKGLVFKDWASYRGPEDLQCSWEKTSW